MRSAIVVALAWTLLVAGSLAWNLHSRHQETLEMANLEAMANLNKDNAFRAWVASHGGVYVPITSETRPNPYLTKLKGRDVATTDGRKLTLMNPAYVIRQVHELSLERFGIHGKITSLKLLNPKNAPDAWETQVLNMFEHGRRKFSEVQTMEGKPVLRVMIALMVQPECLTCHEEQGYKTGDVRGGLGTIVPLAPYLASERNDSRTIIATHSIIWLLVGLAILRVTLTMRQRAQQRLKTARELKHSQMLFQTVTDHATEWVFWRNPDGSLKYVSPVCENICGYSADELIARPELFTEMIHPDDREAWLQHRHAADDDKQPDPLEFRILTKRGEMRWISHACRAVYDEHGAFAGVRGSNADVTERHHKDAWLIRQSRHVAMGEILNNIAHQWRQPLTVLSLMLQNMRLDGMEGVMTEAVVEKYVGEAVKVVNALSRTIDDFRRLFRSDEEIVEFELHSSIQESMALIAATLDACHVTLHIAESCQGAAGTVRVRGYPHQFSQVLLSLLENAKDILIERNVDGGRIDISCHREDSRINLVVRDNGGGISEQLLSRIFEPYVTTKVNGTGLGLFVAKIIMENMGGHITARNTEGGAEFSLMLATANGVEAS